MISYLNTLEVLGTDINGESQANMILQSLPESFKEFRHNYNMNKMIYTLSELMNELVAAEVILGTTSVDTNLVKASSSKPKSKGNGGKKKKEFTKQDGKQLALGIANKGKKKVNDYTKGKCFHCGEKGHWKRNCPKFIVGKNKGVMRSFILEICLVHNPMDSQCMDLGCTNYICNLQGFQETKRLNEGELFRTLANGSKIPIVAVGVLNYALILGF